MVRRPGWAALIEAAWLRKPIVWLTGVRRVGKTTLCQALPDVTYLDCELPSTRRELEEVRRSIGGKHATYGPRDATEVRRVREHHNGWPG